ncbi:MAG TPA: penicillin-binding transpeptidase domain-containing protein [Pyrinomonadaceae bacterium]|nr:penicillin-binding transpeptidase domain-containing protein [Pyrinomonadaceae bacterium]
MLAILLQIDWDRFRPENFFGGQVLERTPAGLSIVFLIGLGILVGFLVISFFENFNRPKFPFEHDLPREVSRRLTQTITNRSLRVWQVVFIMLAFTVFGFQVYWTYYADQSNEQFQALAYKDLRNRRTTAANLRGWMLDRSGKLDAALAYYKVNQNGDIVRTFSLENEMAHLLGTERGTPGLERTLYGITSDPMPEAWDILTKYKKPEPEQKDVRITIDRDLQAFVAEQLKGKKGGIVVINPQTGDVLAMYSNPSYSLSEAGTLEGFLKLEADRENKPLLNRAHREFYIPGSTFKTFTMISALRAGRPDLTFPGRPSSASPPCYTPFRGSRPICDSGGSCNLCSESIPLREAYKVSSNQYFAQLAVALGRDRLAETARVLGIAPTETPSEALTQGFFADLWNTSNRRIANSIAPARSTIVTGKALTAFDIGQEGMGQGMSGQMTPLQMALIAAAPANLQGRLMKPKIEADIAPQVFAQVLTPQQAATAREIMSTVTEESGGTGARVRAKLAGTGIVSGGKTGTAEKDGVPAYDKNGKRLTVTKRKRDENGEWTTFEEPVFRRRTDGWFISIAPLENPTLAIAVVIEDIGRAYGGTTAAPVAADVILKARDLGLLGDRYRPRPTAPPAQRRR